MDCVFCGEAIIGRAIRRDGQVYCSTDCLDTVAEVKSDDDEFRMENVVDDSVDMDYYDEVDEF
ncbi:MAG: hypothetical protein GY865_01625 [candidate division Zixibacteria bacterium]|nr:hypothetical protein [candidate division Zixibacteria bacterium]